MREALHGFCVLAVFCGAALRLTPEGSVKRVMSVLVSAVLLLQIFSGLGLRDAAKIAEEIGRFREAEQRYQLDSEQVRQRLDRLVIEEELKTYIQNKAGQRGLTITDVEPELHWQTDGYWLPRALTIRGSGSETAASVLLRELGAELGIEQERLRWIADDRLEEYPQTTG